ncbi:DUF551 domain-containing protein, partial [Enterobacter ludwigii]
LEAEPVAWRCGSTVTVNKPVADDWKRRGFDFHPLYAAPPAPVSVPDEAAPDNIEILASTYAPRGVTYQWDRDECNAAADSWNACRAAMLNGEKS